MVVVGLLDLVFALVRGRGMAVLIFSVLLDAPPGGCPRGSGNRARILGVAVQ